MSRSTFRADWTAVLEEEVAELKPATPEVHSLEPAAPAENLAIPPVLALDKAQVPMAVDWRSATRAASGATAMRLKARDGALASPDLAAKLERLSAKALDKADDVLDLEIVDDGDEKFGEKVRAVNSAIKTVLHTQVRVDEHRFRVSKMDALPELLELIKDAETKRKLKEVAAAP